jgi:SAM-dependent methyltransferase
MSKAQVSRACTRSYGDRVALMRRLVAPCLNKGSRVLDAGCGRQNCLIGPTDVQELIGVDCNPEALRENRSIHRGIVADLERLSEADVGEKVDFIMCVDVMEHLGNPIRFVGEVAKILKVGGYFFIAAPNKISIAGMLTASLPTHTIKSLSHLIDGEETPNEAHYYRLNTVSRLEGCLRRLGFDDLQFVLLDPWVGRKGSLHRFLFLPDYVIGRMGLLKHYSLRILCLARLATAPSEEGLETNPMPPSRSETSIPRHS